MPIEAKFRVGFGQRSKNRIVGAAEENYFIKQQFIKYFKVYDRESQQFYPRSQRHQSILSRRCVRASGDKR